MGGKLLSAIKSFYEEASACVKISGETSEHFEIKVGFREGCVMSQRLFNIYMDCVMREMKDKVGEIGVRMYAEGRKWVLNSIFLLMTQCSLQKMRMTYKNWSVFLIGEN